MFFRTCLGVWGQRKCNRGSGSYTNRGVQNTHVSVKNVLDFKAFFYLQDIAQYHVSIMLSCDQIGMENKFYILLINTSGIQLMCDVNCGFHETPNLGLELVVLTSGTGTPK